MVPANKILTVAYGTFSCTLEGFDDPFSTMTDIAEYFRDLAADDRFFGAEPPTPDMAMLRTIAETRAKHAVTAQPDEGGVTLRPTAMPAAAAVADATAEAAPQMEEAAIPAEAQNSTQEETQAAETPVADAIEDEATTDIPEIAAPESVAAEAEKAVEEEEDAAEQADVAAEAPDADAEDDSVAAKLARIRGVVEADRQAAGTYAEDEHAEDPMIGAADMASDMASDMADDTLAAAFAADALDEEPVIVEETQADIDTPADLPEADITAEESVAEAAPVEADLDDTIASDLAAILAPETDAAPEVDQVEDAAAQEETAPAEALAEPETPAEVAADAEEPKSEEKSERMERRIRVRKVRRVQAAAEAAALAAADDDVPPAAEETAPVDAAAEAEKIVGTVETRTEADTAPEDSDEDELMAELAAIEAELTRPAAPAEADADADAEAQAQEPVADESPSDDDDLMAELAALRGETPAVAADVAQIDAAAEDDDADVLAEIAEETAEEEIRADKVEEDIADDADVSAPEDDETNGIEDAEEATTPPAPDMERLFAATDSRLSGEDTSRRHANISHLKAAVAARRADGPVEAKEETETDAYRADLASTVRPRRKPLPAETAKRTQRPERSAPLVLVSEQRVEETPEAEAAAPVQPRRAPRTAEMDVQQDALADAEDFESFATDVGASELSDILEAAAVYSAKVMGQDNFSRPRLLHLAAEAVEDMSREDGLRGFGQLLRDGTIRKVSRGTFALAAESRYAQEADRRVG